MGLRQREWAQRVRDNLRETLGGRCKRCGSRRKLEFDCIKPQGPRHHRIEWSSRMSFYRQQHAANNLQLLCQSCHGIKSCRESWSTLNNEGA
jgi:uncharacterized cysteine cluster protein YcgN (CxxCxxCC family)